MEIDNFTFKTFNTVESMQNYFQSLKQNQHRSLNNNDQKPQSLKRTLAQVEPTHRKEPDISTETITDPISIQKRFNAHAKKIFHRILRAFFFSFYKELFIFEIQLLLRSTYKSKSLMIRQILLSQECFKRVKINRRVKWTIDTRKKCMFNQKNFNFNRKLFKISSQSNRYSVTVQHLVKKSKQNLLFNHYKKAK